MPPRYITIISALMMLVIVPPGAAIVMTMLLPGVPYTPPPESPGVRGSSGSCTLYVPVPLGSLAYSLQSVAEPPSEIVTSGGEFGTPENDAVSVRHRQPRFGCAAIVSTFCPPPAWDCETNVDVDPRKAS